MNFAILVESMVRTGRQIGEIFIRFLKTALGSTSGGIIQYTDYME